MSAPLYSAAISDKDQPSRLDRQWDEFRGSYRKRETWMPDYQILRTQYRVTDFVGWQRNGFLQLNPNFQRRSVWKKGRKVIPHRYGCSWHIDAHYILKQFAVRSPNSDCAEGCC